jgi:hypothetical protein
LVDTDQSRVVPIYNSGSSDQANPSSVAIASGIFLTLGYNAKRRARRPPA